MDEREHKRHLIEIKDAAQAVIRKEQFRGLVQDFLRRYNHWQEKLAECKEAAKHNPALRIGKDEEPGEPPQPGWEVETRNEYLLELVDESKSPDLLPPELKGEPPLEPVDETRGSKPLPLELKRGYMRDRIVRRQFWRPPLPPNPVELLMPTQDFDELFQKNDNLTPDRPRDAMKDDKERLAAHAFLIAVVCYKLSDCIIGIELPEYPTDDVWSYYGELYTYNNQEYYRGDKTRSKLRDALAEVKVACTEDLGQEAGGVKADLPAKKPAETEQKATAAKVPISELIKQAEGSILEFKETLIYDTKQNRKSGDVLLSSLKTIAGFLNTGGGTLLIGVVNDSGDIKGIERDLKTMKHGNNDRFELKIRNCLKERFKPQPIGKVNISFEKFKEGTICRVDVQANKEIVHLDDEVCAGWQYDAET